MEPLDLHAQPDHETNPHRPRRWRFTLTTLLVSAALPVAAVGVAVAGQRPAVLSVTIAQFPVQGICTYTDTFGDARPGGLRHEGIDFIESVGHKVYAVDDGTLTQQYLDAPGSASGNGWRLTRADGTYFFYAHMATFAAGLHAGSAVKAGQIIGTSGQSGNAGVPHTHFEVHPKGGAAIDPTPVVQRVDGCSVTKVPPQPSATTTTATTTTVKTTTTTTTKATTTTIATTTTVPATTTTVPLRPDANRQWKLVAPINAIDAKHLAAHSTRPISLASLDLLPMTTTGLMLRITVRNLTAGGNVQLGACGTTPVGVAIVALPGRANSITTVTRLTAGSVCVFDGAAGDLRVDVVGYSVPAGVGLQPMIARRVLDTRRVGSIVAGATIAITSSDLGIRRSDAGVNLTVTLLNPAAAGTFGIGACGTTPYRVAMDAVPSQAFSTMVVTNGSDLCLTADQNVDVVVDVTGAWAGTGDLAAIAPARLYDSRLHSAITTATQQIPLTLPAGTSRAQLTITLVSGRYAGVLYAWPCNSPKPTASVASAPGRSFASVSMAIDTSQGGLCMASNGAVHVTVDLTAAG